MFFVGLLWFFCGRCNEFACGGVFWYSILVEKGGCAFFGWRVEGPELCGCIFGLVVGLFLDFVFFVNLI